MPAGTWLSGAAAARFLYFHLRSRLCFAGYPPVGLKAGVPFSGQRPGI
jgi:hypothetical protein